jgi:hypothetical protein
VWHVPSSPVGAPHTHPFFNGAGNNLALPAMPPPEDLDTAPLSYLEIQLTATDAQGLTKTVTQTLQPNRVLIAFVTAPPGLQVSVGGVALTATKAITSWQAATWPIAAPALQPGPSNTFYSFVSWSDGGPISHTITTPASAITYTATFTLFTPTDFVWLPDARK